MLRHKKYIPSVGDLLVYEAKNTFYTGKIVVFISKVFINNSFSHITFKDLVISNTNELWKEVFFKEKSELWISDHWALSIQKVKR